MLFVLILLDFLGIGEYVFPIVIPIFVGTGLLMFIIFGIVAIVVNLATRRASMMDQALTRSYDAKRVAGSDYLDEYPPGAFYRIPVYCPYCQEPIDLGDSQWLGSSRFICTNCRNEVRVEISED